MYIIAKIENKFSKMVINGKLKSLSLLTTPDAHIKILEILKGEYMDEEIFEKENQEELEQQEIAVEEQTESQEEPKKKSFKEKLKETDKKNGGVWQAIKYFLCAASAGVIQFVTFTILSTVFDKTGVTASMGKMWFFGDMDKSLFMATTIALALSIIWNFTLNRKFTFKAANNVPLAMALAFLFYVPFYPFQTWYVGAVTGAIRDSIGQQNATWPSIIAEGTVMLINGILEFCWQKFVVFRKPKKTEQAEEAPADEISAEEQVENTETEGKVEE